MRASPRGVAPVAALKPQAEAGLDPNGLSSRARDLRETVAAPTPPSLGGPAAAQSSAQPNNPTGETRRRVSGGSDGLGQAWQ